MEEVNYFLGLFIEQTNHVQIRSKSTNLMSSIFYWMLCFISQRREEIILVLITMSLFNRISIILNIYTKNFEKVFSCWLRPLRVTLFMLSAVFMFNSNSMSKQNITRPKIWGGSKVKTLPWPALFFEFQWAINWPILCYWSLSIPPENIRKPEVFSFFLEV